MGIEYVRTYVELVRTYDIVNWLIVWLILW